MPEFDLSNATALRIANKTALEIRVADQTVWTIPPSATDHTVFGTNDLSVTTTQTYTVYDDFEAGGWLANNFYITGSPVRNNWKVAGARIWIPLDYSGPLLGQSGYVSLAKVGDELDGVVWGNLGASFVQNIINQFEINGSKTPFSNLQNGWNDIYFSQEWDLIHGNGFAIGYTIGDGTYYIHGNGLGDAVQAQDGTNLYLSYGSLDDYGEKRGEYGIPEGDAEWSIAHYGIDVIIREPAPVPSDEHSIWGIYEPEGAEYTTSDDLVFDGWTANNFYSFGPEQTGWTLIGARYWVPPPSRGEYNLIGMSAECGYYIKPTGVISSDNDDPLNVVQNGIAVSPTVTTTLVQGWNTVYFDTPVEIPWGAGIAIGWKIDDGAYYSGAQLSAPAIESLDGSPFKLAAAGLATEARGEFTYESTNASWSYVNVHYSIDLVVREP